MQGSGVYLQGLFTFDNGQRGDYASGIAPFFFFFFPVETCYTLLTQSGKLIYGKFNKLYQYNDR
jgi:hypothetical protein